MIRYSGQYPGFFWSMDADDAIPVLFQAKQHETDDKLFQRWLNGYQWEMSFDEFKQKLRPLTNKDAKTILKEVAADYDRAFGKGMVKAELDY